jgi:hypothetical protein
MKTYTIEQIRIWLETQDSFGDIFYNLKEENIDKANIDKRDENVFLEEDDNQIPEDAEFYHDNLGDRD